MNNIKHINKYNYTKHIVFYLISFLYLLLEYLPNKSSLIIMLKPSLITSFLFYFFIYRNDKIAYSFILIIALIYDSLTNYYIGSFAICFFLTLTIFEGQKKLFYFNNFSELWLAYIIFIIEFAIINIMIIYYLNNEIVNIKLFILNIISSAIFYPIMHNLYLFTSFLIDDNK